MLLERERSTREGRHVTSTGDFFEAMMFRGQGRPGNVTEGPGNAFDFEKSTNFVKKIDFFYPTSYMYEPRGWVHEVGCLAVFTAGSAPLGLRGGRRARNVQRERRGVPSFSLE